jgi:uncharacterized protein YaiL (DUF2058 family)
MAEKVKRDQELNRQQQEKAEQKARAAQIKQLIEATRLPKLTTEDYYNFVDDKKVKRIAVNALMRTKLSNGALAIVPCRRLRSDPARSGVKIQERDPSVSCCSTPMSRKRTRTIRTRPTRSLTI